MKRLVNPSTAVADRLAEYEHLVASTPDLDDADIALLLDMAERHGYADAEFDVARSDDFRDGLPFTPVRRILFNLAPWSDGREHDAYMRTWEKVVAREWAAFRRGEDHGLSDDELAACLARWDAGAAEA